MPRYYLHGTISDTYPGWLKELDGTPHKAVFAYLGGHRQEAGLALLTLYRGMLRSFDLLAADSPPLPYDQWVLYQLSARYQTLLSKHLIGPVPKYYVGRAIMDLRNEVFAMLMRNGLKVVPRYWTHPDIHFMFEAVTGELIWDSCVN